MKKICITGPENSGKTTLAAELARHYNFGLVPELAREYLEKGNQIKNQKDIIQLAKHQILIENELAGKHDVLICDTDLLVLKIWIEERFPPLSSMMNALFIHHIYDITLLCTPDLEWAFDPLRQNPFDRDRLFEKYKITLDTFQRPYQIIKGKNKSRVQLAIEYIEPFLK